MVVLKPVFIIALVAVAMIGMIVPSVFADQFDGVNLSQLQLTLQESSLVESTDANVLIIKLKAKNNSDSEIGRYDIYSYLNSGSAVYKADYGSNLKEYGVSENVCSGGPDIPAGLSKNIVLCFIIPKDHSYPFTLNLYDNEKSYCGLCEYCTCTSTSMAITNTISNIPIVESVPEPTPEPTPELASELASEPAPELTSEPNCGTGTILKNGQCVVDTSKSSKGGGCLIATATYGSELAPQVQQLRELRDNSLLQTESGTQFMNTFNDIYYSFSPVIADYERENPIFKEMVKIAITPMVSSLSILNYVDMDSESEVLGYGISLIMLNGLMYVGIPAMVIIKIRK